LGASTSAGTWGNSLYDPTGRVVVVAVASGNQVVVIDPAHDVVVHRYDTRGCDGAHGVYLDDPTQVAYVACERNARAAPSLCSRPRE
jgi:DNA-binding beta-propeller fold protein YncE